MDKFDEIAQRIHSTVPDRVDAIAAILRDEFPQGYSDQKPDFGICDHCGEHLEQKDIDRYGVSWCHTIPVYDGHGEPEPAPCGPVVPYYLHPATSADRALREAAQAVVDAHERIIANCIDQSYDGKACPQCQAIIDLRGALAEAPQYAKE